jgi:hypothetical protein
MKVPPNRGDISDKGPAPIGESATGSRSTDGLCDEVVPAPGDRRRRSGRLQRRRSRPHWGTCRTAKVALPPSGGSDEGRTTIEGVADEQSTAALLTSG